MASAIVLVNRLLKKKGRPERVVKGRGYYYVSQSNLKTTIISGGAWDLRKATFEELREEVINMFKTDGIPIEI